MDCVYDLVNVNGCIFHRRLMQRAVALGATYDEAEQSLCHWEQFGIMQYRDGVVLMLIDDGGMFAPLAGHGAGSIRGLADEPSTGAAHSGHEVNAFRLYSL